MNKMYLYPPDDIVAKIQEVAKKEKSSLSATAIELINKGLKSGNIKAVDDYGCFEMPKDIIEKIESYSENDKIPKREVAVLLMRQAIKEKERLREKYLKSLEKK